MTVFSATITEIIDTKSTAFLPNTKIKGGSQVDGKKVNFSIGQALLTLHDLEGFGLGNIEFENLFETVNGYVFQSNKVQILIEFDINTKRVERIFVNETKENTDNRYLLQSLILLEMLYAPEEFELNELINEILEYPDVIKKEDEIAKKLATAVFVLEERLKNERLRPSEILYMEDIKNKIDEDYSIDFEEGEEILSFNPSVVSSVPSPPKINTISKEEVASIEITPYQEVLEEEVSPVTIKEQQPVSIKTVITKPPVTESFIKSEKPNVFDDLEIIKYLRNFDDITEQDIEDVLKFRRNQLKLLPLEAMLDIEPVPFYAGETEPLLQAIDCILTDVNLILKGEAGSGKTTLIQSISCLLNIPLYTINGSDESNIETIVGFKEIENGRIVFKEGRLTKAMRVGGIFYADEANMIRPNILAVINAATDHRKELYNEFTGERIKGHKNFRFMSSINEDYEDTRQMNRATLDRAVAMTMSYMSAEQLKKMLETFDPGYTDFQKEELNLDHVSPKDIILLTKIAQALQLAVKKEEIEPEVASIRNIIHLLKLSRRRPLKIALKRIVDKYPKESRPKIAQVLARIPQLDIKAEDICKMSD